MTELAASIAELYEQAQECERLGGDPGRAFAAGFPPDFAAKLVAEQPLLGSIFLMLGIRVG